MALFETHRAPAHVNPTAGFLGTLFTVYADWSERRATRAMLHRLSDRELDDIGLTRGDIDRAL